MLLHPSLTSNYPNEVARGLKRPDQTMLREEGLISAWPQMQLAMPNKIRPSNAALRRPEERRGDLVVVALLRRRLSSISLLVGMCAPPTGDLLKPCLGGPPQHSLRCQRRVSLGQRHTSLTQIRISFSRIHRHLFKLLLKQLFLPIHENTPPESFGHGNQR